MCRNLKELSKTCKKTKKKNQLENTQGQINEIRNSVEDKTVTNSMADSKQSYQKEKNL